MEKIKAIAVLVTLLISFQLSYGLEYQPGIPFIRYYSSAEYNGGIQNWAITQNKSGLIYVANNFGVLEYDGTSWRRYAPTSGTKVRHVNIDTQGKIYVASQGDFGFLFPDEQGELQYTSLADSLNPEFRNFDETWRIFIDHERVIFGTFKQIFIYHKNGNIEVVDPVHAPEGFFYTDHQLYVHQPEIGISYLDGLQLKLLEGGSTLKGMTITGIINLPNEELWISTLKNGIYIYNGHEFIKWNEKSTAKIIRQAINCAIRLKNGNFAIGTQNSGIYIISPDGETLLHLDKSKGLNNRTVLSIFEDAQNNLWLGHNNGISFIELGMPFSYINEQVGLPGTGYTGILDDGKLYLGTNNGLYTKQMDDSTAFGFQFIPNTEGQVYSMQSINGHLLMGHHKGAYKVDHFKANQISDVQGAWTFLRLKNNPDYIIEGTYKGLILHKIIDGQIIFQHKIKGFEESSRVMEQDNDGNIWMTHGYKGVYRLTFSKNLDSVESVVHFSTEDGLPSNMLINVFRIRNQMVFTTQNQIYRFDKTSQRFVPDTFFQSFFSNDPVVALAEDPFQNIYYITQNDIGVLEKSIGGQYHKKNDIFHKLKDMLNDDLHNITVIGNNKVLYGAKEGFILYDASNKPIIENPFPVMIRQVKSTGNNGENLFYGFHLKKGEMVDKQPQEKIPRLSYDQNSLQVLYSAAFIDGLGKTQYQFLLEGVDNSWSEWSAKTEKEYTNLTEGEYIFHVRARNIYGNISDPARYSFIVLPPWYRTNLAYLFYSVTIISLLFSSFYLFDKKHKREKNLMSIKQQKELNKKETEIQNITQETANEIERLKNEKLIAEIESKNKELATSTMHLINKNSFISGMKNNLMNISKRSKNEEVKKELKKIVSNIEKNISQDADWQHFSFHFDQVHGDFTSRLKQSYPDLSPQEMKLAAYLRMNLSTKEVAHLLNISVRGVEICRYRLRKKLNLSRPVNLQEYILKF